jgi:hypothetical protein
MSIAPGTRLGPYEVLAPLGAGGMGEVYRARDARLKRDVAVKVLPASLSSDPDRLRRFELEAESAGRLNHPNILAIYDIGMHEGSPYVVSELLEGETLRDRLSAGALTARRAIEYARAIATGLAAAHEKGIVHRDLKPENVFVTADGRVKILDFGLAKLTQPDFGASDATGLATASPGTEPGVVLGTVGYMSPEQVRGAPVDHRSDVFSFGAILYEMLTGARAFRGDSAVEAMNAILKEEPPEPSESGRSVTPGLERIVRHCLEKNPALRFQSARDLAFDLESLSEISSTVTRALPSGPARRRALLPVLVGLGVLALAAGVYLAGIRTSRPRFPVFQRLTFRDGTVFLARFAPDGQTIVYSGAWDGAAFQLFSTRPGSAESRSLGLPPAYIASISRDGEMAVVLNPSGALGAGTLARVPLAGGAPRPILQDVRLASWAPDGKSLAVTRMVGGRQRVEYPVGKPIYETEGFVNDLRVSPDGNRIHRRNGLDRFRRSRREADHPLHRVGAKLRPRLVAGRQGSLVRDPGSVRRIPRRPGELPPGCHPDADADPGSPDDPRRLPRRAVTLHARERSPLRALRRRRGKGRADALVARRVARRGPLAGRPKPPLQRGRRRGRGARRGVSPSR